MGNRRLSARIAVLFTLAAVSVSDAAVDGTNIWTAGAGTTDWHTAGNWGFNTVPTALLSAKFADVGGLVTADENAALIAALREVVSGDGPCCQAL